VLQHECKHGTWLLVARLADSVVIVALVFWSKPKRFLLHRADLFLVAQAPRHADFITIDGVDGLLLIARDDVEFRELLSTEDVHACLAWVPDRADRTCKSGGGTP